MQLRTGRIIAMTGITSMKVGNPDEQQSRVRQAMELNSPVLIEVPVDRTQKKPPWPFLMPEVRGTA